MFGIHGADNGSLGNSDEKLVESFNKCISQFNGECCQKNCDKVDAKKDMRVKNITIKPLEIRTEETGGKYELYHIDDIVKKVKESNVVILAFCNTTINEINSFFRSKGLYADLYMQKDLSNLHGKLCSGLSIDQTKKLKDFVETKPTNILVLGPYGCGKTVVNVQCLSIRISEFERMKNDYRIIVAVDLRKGNELLEELKEKHLKFIQTEIDGRRSVEGRPPVDVIFTTFKELLIKYKIKPNSDRNEDRKVMEILVKRNLLSENGWFHEGRKSKGAPNVTAALLLTECELSDLRRCDEILEKLKNESSYGEFVKKK